MNIIARSLFHVVLSYYYDDIDFIRRSMKSVYKDGYLHVLKTENDFGFAYETHTSVIGCIRGTHGWLPWLNNFDFADNGEGFHSGWVESFEPLWDKIKPILKDNPTKVSEWSAHSRGCPLATLTALRARKELGRYIKPILFCPPQLANEKGMKVLHDNRIDQINIINPNDPVDNVGINGFFGGHHGTTIILPNKENGFVQIMKDLIPGIGHAPKEIIDGTAQYFYGRGMTKEADYVKSFRKVAKI